MPSSIYMKMDDIEGESTHASFPKWSEILDANFEITYDASEIEEEDFEDDEDDVDDSEDKKSKKKERITADIGAVTVNKYMDLASTSIIHKCWLNSQLKKVDIVFLRPDGTTPGLDYFRIEMQEVHITEYKTEYAEGDIMKEEIKLLSKKVQYIYKSSTQKINGKPVQRKLFVCDLVKRTSE